ncbi:MAG: hypothetical protein DRJ03_02540 [Chloroflexi bacterium]|nr:MAG: hypothetical protein DRJ03_02540 [Chloroflexota bacterium]
MINGRNKGAAAEREAGKWLKEQFNLLKAPERNLEQVRSGGYDLVGFYPFAVEVKRCEVLALRDWWLQVVQATDGYMVPVVMYRQNRCKWQFLVSAKNIGLDTGYIHLEAREFVMWAKAVMT